MSNDPVLQLDLPVEDSAPIVKVLAYAAMWTEDFTWFAPVYTGTS